MFVWLRVTKNNSRSCRIYSTFVSI